MIKKILSRYSLKYPRSLIYMLQASEYKISDYFSWYRRTSDFRQVEKRKQLIKTPKAILLLVFTWLILGTLYMLAFSFFWINATPINYLACLLIVLVAPNFLAYAIFIPLLFIKIFIQWPAEYLILRQTKQKLQSHNAVKIAIAGSFGKTTMREILKTVLSEGKKVSAPPHSYNTPLGISQFVKNLKGDEEILVFEFGEYYPGDIKKLCQLVNPQIGIITGINEAHLEKFKNLERTANTIFELADWLKKNPVYINGENKLARQKAFSNHQIYTKQGMEPWNVKNLHTTLQGTSFTLSKGGATIEVRSQLLGIHQVGPLVAVAAIATYLGLSSSQIERGLNNTKAFDHRLEPKIDINGIVTLDDSYNGNPDGVNAVIDFLASLKNHRRFYVTPGLVEIGSRTESVHQQIGQRLAQAGIEKIILIKNSVTPFIEQGLKNAGYKGEILWFNDGLSAFSALPHLTVKGDVVLLQNDWPDQYQ